MPRQPHPLNLSVTPTVGTKQADILTVPVSTLAEALECLRQTSRARCTRLAAQNLVLKPLDVARRSAEEARPTELLATLRKSSCTVSTVYIVSLQYKY